MLKLLMYTIHTAQMLSIKNNQQVIVINRFLKKGLVKESINIADQIKDKNKR